MSSRPLRQQRAATGGLPCPPGSTTDHCGSGKKPAASAGAAASPWPRQSRTAVVRRGRRGRARKRVRKLHRPQVAPIVPAQQDSESSISCHFGRNGCNDIRKVRNRAISQLSASQNSKGLPPPCQVPRFRLRTAGACAIRRLRAVCEIRSRYPRCLRAACAMLAHTAAAKHSMMAPQARNTT